MEKYSKIAGKKEEETENNILYQDDYVSIKKFDNWSILFEKDTVCIVPVLTEQNKILLRQEVIPSYKVRDGQEYHLTVISGTMEEGENPTDTVKREILEEAGLILNSSYKIEFLDCLFKSKSGSSKTHFCILPLSNYEYQETYIKGDGSEAEKLSKTVKVDIKFINNLFPADTQTRLMLLEVQKYLNLL